MNISTHRISLDVAAAASHSAVTLRQGENAHRLEISFTDNGLPYSVSGECYAVFAAKKSDGTQLLNNCAIVNDTVIYDLTAQTTAAPGRLVCEVRLYGAADKLLIAPKFSMFVEDSAIDESGIESSDEFSALNALISQTATAAVFRLKGYFAAAEDLAQLSDPAAGDAYGIGPASPYEIYVWDGVNGEWVNHGTLQGEAGVQGPAGPAGAAGVSGVYVGSGEAPAAYNVQIDPEGSADELVTEAPKDGKQYARQSGQWAEVIGGGGGGTSDVAWKPTVDSSGNISWQRSASTAAPETQNIRGPQGNTGAAGAQGPQGIQGPAGQDGSDAEVTSENIVSALGYTPADEDDLDGKADKPLIKTAMDAVAVAGAQYYLGVQSAVSITMPTAAEVGQEITVCFSSGATACTLDCDLTGFTFVPKANKTSRIQFTYYGGGSWLVETKEG